VIREGALHNGTYERPTVRRWAPTNRPERSAKSPQWPLLDVIRPAVHSVWWDVAEQDRIKTILARIWDRVIAEIRRPGHNATRP